MTVIDILTSLRQRLFDAAEQNDRAANELFTTLSLLREISYEGTNREFTGILVDLVDVARDITMGVKGKHGIPSVEAIRLACNC